MVRRENGELSFFCYCNYRNYCKTIDVLKGGVGSWHKQCESSLVNVPSPSHASFLSTAVR